jgi:uncharacterized protein (DUF2384 family)
MIACKSAAYSTGYEACIEIRLRDNGGMLDEHRISEKVGRNDQCPCGSGKKYKHCCLREAHAAIYESPWRKQHDASGRLTSEFMRFANSEFGEALLEAWQDFNQEFLPPLIDEFPGEEQIFMPYFLFDWDPDRPVRSRAKQRKPGIVAQAFVEKRAKRLGELEQIILHLSIYTPLSFYEVLQVRPGFGMRLRDVFLGTEVEVEEHAGSDFLQPGDIVYAQLCRLPEVTAVGRMAPHALRPGLKAELVELRAWMRRKAARQNRELNEGDLVLYEEKLRAQYLNARDAMFTPPVLTNTDGDLFHFHTLRYEVGSAQVAFDALAPLSWGVTREELLEEAEMNPDGSLRSVHFDWRKSGNAMHKSWDNTILGHLKIEGRSLTVEVNSAKRAEKIRGEIEKRLGFLAVHKGTSTQSQEQMRQAIEQKKLTQNFGQAEAEFTATDPEAREIAAEMLRQHAEEWIDTKIPALRGRTPRQAVADADGREMVEGLLKEWERRNQDSNDPVMRSFDVNTVRRKLGL